MDDRNNSSLGLPDYFLSGDVLDYEIPLDEIPDTTQGRAFFVATIVIAVVLLMNQIHHQLTLTLHDKQPPMFHSSMLTTSVMYKQHVQGGKMDNLCVSGTVTVVPVSLVSPYMAILYPLRPRMKHQTAYCVILTVWIVPIFISIPSALMFSETKYPHKEGRSHKTFCAQIWPVDQQLYYRSYFLLIFALEFMVPVTVMAVCYIQISRELWFKDVPGFQTQQIQKRLQSRRRTVVVLILVLVAYVLCWAPYYGYALLRDFYPTLISRDRNSLVVFYIIECLAMSNGVINTLCFMSVRKNTKRLKKAGKFPLRLVTFVPAKSSVETETRTLSLRVTDDTEGGRLK
ncbi:hypothetical protein F7725_006020 [Dissostichus mawsoni]|uniref:G-protein coupled receptors family 1 profile domain-containing protein n=1 Tax=Dissostichus mawsoni TaxID=36200 RepID=A0A7J5YT72_DISMA|nr:hypothetical protein F7725_006020 [Dissostichus mawsoni]